jgi:hypothetical protein
MKTQFKSLPKLHLACSSDELRPVMNHILVTKSDVCASDAHILVNHATSNLFDEEFIASMPDRFLINSKHWQLMCKKHLFVTFDKEMIRVIYSYGEVYYPIYTEKSIGSYPDFNQVFPKETDKGEVGEIGIKPSLLNRLCLTMRGEDDLDNLKLTFHGCNRAVVVRLTSNTNVRGLIMPCTIYD